MPEVVAPVAVAEETTPVDEPAPVVEEVVAAVAAAEAVQEAAPVEAVPEAVQVSHHRHQQHTERGHCSLIKG